MCHAFFQTVFFSHQVFDAPFLAETYWDHPMQNIPGMSKAFLMFDIMHTLDLGITLHVIGNALFTILYVDMSDEKDKHHGFNLLWLRLQKIMEDTGQNRDLSSMGLLNIISDPKSPWKDYPLLRGIKAAEARHLIRPVAVLAAEYAKGDVLKMHRSLVCNALVNIYDIIELDQPGAKLPAALAILGLHYGHLAKKAMISGKYLWSIVPKFHYAEHLVTQGVFEDIKLFWSYSGEDYVGRIGRLAHLCIFGKKSMHMSPILIERFRIGFCLRLNIHR